MRIKSLIILGSVAIIGVGAGLLGFWFGPHDQAEFVASADTNTEISSQNKVDRIYPSVADKEMYDIFLQNARPVVLADPAIYSLVLPHHLVAGHYEAGIFNALNQLSPPVVVVIGPNHRQVGASFLATSDWSWNTPYGQLNVDQDLLNKVTKDGLVSVDNSVLDGEHAVGVLTPFIKKTWPNTKLLPIVIKANKSEIALDKLAEKLKEILPKNSLVIASVDFSHYLPLEVANFHDELAVAVLERGQIERTQKLEVDSPNSLRVLMRYNSLLGAEKFNFVFHTNSADIMGQPALAETTSHVMGYFTKGEPKRDSFVSLQFFGDMMLERSVQRNFGKKGLDYVFEKIKGRENRFFYGADWTVANLEGPFAPARVPTTKSIAFRFDPSLAPSLKRYNFSAFSLANNHSLDMGIKNVGFTQKVLEQNGLKYFGYQTKQGPEYTLLAGEKDGLPENVAFIGYNDVGSPINKKKIKTAIDEAKKQAQYIIVWPHWGEEYKRISNKSQREMGHWLIDQGVTAVIGNHPHVIQEMEIYKDRPIFYALGNFVFDQYFSKDTQEGISVGMTFENGNVKNISVFPFSAVKSQDKLMTGKSKDKFFEWWNKNSRLGDKRFVNGVLSKYILK
ncbi:MAG: AmmeMemoRadiSam system protein B [bacterium]|nr:AmmeMemoRadiSam system protein B [bacterium]